jgi:hypothetical protein
VLCLQQLHQAGQFLRLDSPAWAVAGTPQRNQAWEAALEACGADHADVLKWLLSGGWPLFSDTAAPLQGRDAYEGRRSRLPVNVRDALRSISMSEGVKEAFFVYPIWPLLSKALANPTPACWQVIIDAGCRSELLCWMAIAEQKEAYLELALRAGFRTASVVIELAFQIERRSPAFLRMIKHSWGREVPKMRLLREKCLHKRASDAVMRGDVQQLKAILGSLGSEARFGDLAAFAAAHGHLECMQILEGYIASAMGVAVAGFSSSSVRDGRIRRKLDTSLPTLMSTPAYKSASSAFGLLRLGFRLYWYCCQNNCLPAFPFPRPLSFLPHGHICLHLLAVFPYGQMEAALSVSGR